MVLLLTVSKAQQLIARQIKEQRLSQGLTQAGLANRSGVSLPTLRKFEQKGLISLESFLKLLLVLGCLEDFVEVFEKKGEIFNSIDEVLEERPKKLRKHGWRT
jgi:transcriptional regulator with XRE-family HTH domain